MICNEANNDGIRFKLLQESIWSNGDKLSGIVEHVTALEEELIKVRRMLEQAGRNLDEISKQESEPTEE